MEFSIAFARRIGTLAVLIGVLSGCGDKVPESQAAKSVGAAPKQTVDAATSAVGKAMEESADRAAKVDETK